MTNRKLNDEMERSKDIAMMVKEENGRREYEKVRFVDFGLFTSCLAHFLNYKCHLSIFMLEFIKTDKFHWHW